MSLSHRDSVSIGKMNFFNGLDIHLQGSVVKLLIMPNLLFCVQYLIMHALILIDVMQFIMAL